MTIRKVYACRSHNGVWLSGVSVVVAHSEAEAYEMLDAELVKSGLKPRAESNYTLEEVKGYKAVILFNGDY